jgi:arginyl-tRNA synthetase
LKPLPDLHAELISAAIRSARAAGELPELDSVPTIDVKPPRSPEQGDYGCPVALALAKPARMKPLDIANIIAKHIPSAEFVGAVDVAPPGFINFRLNEDWLRDQINRIIDAGDSYATLNAGAGKRAQVEFLSANPTGPITVGRSRGAILGDAIARVLEATGYDVQREYYFNNAGAQMRKLGESLRIRYLQALDMPVDMPPEEDFYQGEYLIDFAQQLIDERGKELVDADWQAFKAYGERKMFEWIKATLDRIDIYHDEFFNENDLYDNGAVWEVLEQLQEAGYVYEGTVEESESDEVKEQNKHLKPAQWFRSRKFGDDKDRVLVKSNGEPTYTLPDIAYHINKLERGFDLAVNILGSDHKTEAQVVRNGVQALGFDPTPINVVFMQMVRIVENGEVKKMSTRRGVYDTLDELIDLTSADAVRYFLVQRSPDSQLDFDLSLAVKQTNENPVYYIQYAHVRCLGILREAEARGVTDDGADLSLLGDEELAFIRKMLELHEQLAHAAANLAPHTIAYYALDLANAFHPMYDRVRAFSEGVPNDLARARLRFYKAAQVAFDRVLRLMGMSAPERM